MAKKTEVCKCANCKCGFAHCKCGMKCGLMWGWLLMLFGLVGLYSMWAGADGLLQFSKWWPAIFVFLGLKKLYFAYQK